MPIVLKDNIAVKKGDNLVKTYNRLMFIGDEKEKYKLSHILITSKKETFDISDKDFNFYKINPDFEGTITVLNNKNKVDYYSTIPKKTPSTISTLRSEDQICLCWGSFDGNGTFTIITVISCTSAGDGGVGGGGGDGGNGSYGGEGLETDETKAQIMEDNIDYSQLDPCLKAVFEQLKNASNSDIASIFERLGQNRLYSVNMVMGSATTYAETQRIYKNNYEIRVNRDSYTDGTTLFKATALLHEVIHAYFLSIVDDYNNNYPTNAPMDDFPTLFEAYVKKTFPNPDDADHKVMAEKYVDAMASVLQEYDGNYSVPYQVYKDLAWGGLSAAPIFSKTFPPGSDESVRILNRYRAESSGHTIGAGTKTEQTPVGKPCK